MTFHKRLKETRQSRKTSIRRICCDLKIQKSTYENWEINVYPSRPELYKKLAEYLDVPLECFLFGERKNTEWEQTVSHVRKYVEEAIQSKRNEVLSEQRFASPSMPGRTPGLMTR